MGEGPFGMQYSFGRFPSRPDAECTTWWCTNKGHTPYCPKCGGKFLFPLTEKRLCSKCGEEKYCSDEERYCRECGGAIQTKRWRDRPSAASVPEKVRWTWTPSYCSSCGYKVRTENGDDKGYCSRCGKLQWKQDGVAFLCGQCGREGVGKRQRYCPQCGVKASEHRRVFRVSRFCGDPKIPDFFKNPILRQK